MFWFADLLRNFSLFVIVVLGFMFYAIGRELFSGQSPNGIYSRAFKLCKNNEQAGFTVVLDLILASQLVIKDVIAFLNMSENR